MSETDIIALEYDFAYETESRGQLVPVEVPVVERAISIVSDLMQLDRYVPRKEIDSLPQLVIYYRSSWH